MTLGYSAHWSMCLFRSKKFIHPAASNVYTLRIITAWTQIIDIKIFTNANIVYWDKQWSKVDVSEVAGDRSTNYEVFTTAIMCATEDLCQLYWQCAYPSRHIYVSGDQFIGPIREVWNLDLSVSIYCSKFQFEILHFQYSGRQRLKCLREELLYTGQRGMEDITDPGWNLFNSLHDCETEFQLVLSLCVSENWTFEHHPLTATTQRKISTT